MIDYKIIFIIPLFDEVLWKNRDFSPGNPPVITQVISKKKMARVWRNVSSTLSCWRRWKSWSKWVKMSRIGLQSEWEKPKKKDKPKPPQAFWYYLPFSSFRCQKRQSSRMLELIRNPKIALKLSVVTGDNNSLVNCIFMIYLFIGNSISWRSSKKSTTNKEPTDHSSSNTWVCLVRILIFIKMYSCNLRIRFIKNTVFWEWNCSETIFSSLWLGLGQSC